MMNSGWPQRAPDGGPPDKAQRNFTDPDSRLQPSKGGFIQGYNAQAAVDGAAQVIVAQHVTTTPAEGPALEPLRGGIRRNLGRNPQAVSADSGYWRGQPCDDGSTAHRRLHRNRTRQTRPSAGKRRAHHQARLARGGNANQAQAGRAPRRYRLRKQIVEPVFGQIKAARGFRQFLLRGFDKVKQEWAILCTVHNLLKLANART